MDSLTDTLLAVLLVVVVAAIVWLERARLLALTSPPSATAEGSDSGGYYWRLIRQTGLSPATAGPIFIGIKVALAVLLPLLPLFFFDFSAWMLLLAVVGFLIPDVVLAYARKQRQNTIRRALSFFLDLLVSLMQAGLSVEQAFRRAALDGLPAGHPLAREAMQVLEELSLGRDRSLGFTTLADRTGVAEFRSLANALGLALTQGGSIENTLRAQADVARARRREDGLRRLSLANAQVLFPLMLCGFPVFIVLLFVPLAMRIIESLQGIGTVLRLR